MISGIPTPYYRIYRPLMGRTDSAPYLHESEYAADRISRCRAFYMIHKDFERVFEYVEPGESNRETYSERLFEILLRTCTEFEANCKAILLANKYNGKRQLDIRDFKLIDKATQISKYKVRLRVWLPEPTWILPLEAWGKGNASASPFWWDCYNRAKHDRSNNLNLATLEQCVHAMGGLLCVLFAQFHHYATNPVRQFVPLYMTEMDEEGNEIISPPGGLFDVIPFVSWTDDQKYNFDWDKIKSTPNRFQQFHFAP